MNEDVATDALAYVLASSDAARLGMNKLLRGLVPEMPDLQFKTQQAEGTIRPDMWGFADAELRVFVENKFWAGLTPNQPVFYLKKLAASPSPTVLLVVGPDARQQTLRSELTRRLAKEGIRISDHALPAGITFSARTEIGPIIALTSWSNVLSELEKEALNEPLVRADLSQLRALCDDADVDAFSPVSLEELSNQRTPKFVLELSSIWQSVIDVGVARGVLDLKGTTYQASAERIGRYTYFAGGVEGGARAGAWVGMNFRLWKKHGRTPLWAVFSSTSWGQAGAVQRVLEPWASREGILALLDEDGSFVVALDLPAREEKAAVVEAVVQRLEKMACCWNTREQGKAQDHTHE